MSWPAPVYDPALTTCTPDQYNIACFLAANLNHPPAARRRRRRRRGAGEQAAPARAWPHGRRRVMLAGKWPPGDESYRGRYETWPLGLVQEVFPTGQGHGRTGGAEAAGAEREAPWGEGFVEWVRESAAGLPPAHRVRALLRACGKAKTQTTKSTATHGAGEGAAPHLDNWDIAAAEMQVDQFSSCFR